MSVLTDTMKDEYGSSSFLEVLERTGGGPL